MSTTREWRDIPWAPDYRVSDDGLIASKQRVIMRSNGRQQTVQSRILKSPLSDHYPQVNLTVDGKKLHRFVHCIVAEIFHGPRPAGLVIRHRNHDRTDPRASNLEYGTHADNRQDTTSAGLDYNQQKTHCIHGHEFTPENTRTRADRPGTRECRTCHTIRNQNRDRRRYR